MAFLLGAGGASGAGAGATAAGAGGAAGTASTVGSAAASTAPSWWGYYAPKMFEAGLQGSQESAKRQGQQNDQLMQMLMGGQSW